MYSKSAKFEYSRHIVFENIGESPEEIKRCLEKIENDVEKNIEALKELDQDYISNSTEYKIRKDELNRCQCETKKYKEAFEEVYEKLVNINSSISSEDINFIKGFISSDNKDIKKELNDILNENGIKEKNPFDADVISNAVDISSDIFRREFEIYVNAYDKVQKLFNEIEANDVKLEKHKKFLSDSKVKLHFLFAEKEYIIQFLDNERIAAIYGKKTHRKLMLEACRNLNNDLQHINNLYDIIIKEAAGRSSKRLYKDNYDIGYLGAIEKDAENIERENDKLKENAAVVINLNYWRIEGIGRIQEVFENDIKEVYGRDITEIFPEKIEVVEDVEVAPEIIEQVVDVEEVPVIEEVKEAAKVMSKTKYHRLKSSKAALANALYKLGEYQSNFEDEDDSDFDEEESKIILSWEKEENDSVESEKIEAESNEEDDLESEIATEKSQETMGLYEKIALLDELDDEDLSDMKNLSSTIENAEKEDEELSKDEDDSIIDWYFKNQKATEETSNKELIKKASKKGIFSKLIGMNSKTKSEA